MPRHDLEAGGRVMQITLKEELITAIGVSKLKQYGMTEDQIKFRKQLDVNLGSLSPKQVQMIVDLIRPHGKVKGVPGLLRDCEGWQAAVGGKAVKARNVKQFHSLVRLHIKKAPDHWLYAKDDSGVWQCYYVAEVEYHPPITARDSNRPAYAEIRVVWTELGKMHGERVNFEEEDCVGLTPAEALGRKGYMTQNEALLSEYDRRYKLFYEYADKVGKQFTAVGLATDNLDGNREGRSDDSWYWRRVNTIQLDKDGIPARVVIDVFREIDKVDRDRDRDVYADRLYWIRGAGAGGEEDGDEDEDGIDADEVPMPPIPLHPTLACFDLKRHLRLRIDVGQLTEYVYDPKLAEKLVLPWEQRTLVEMLLAHKGGFQDIVSGKSGGSIVLCAGAPGTGKTLTAEVYAEAMERPLFSVQASQLGLKVSDLEDELLKVFARASRWNAILLIDEADVYVHKRGDDLVQNAIVGVFLRVLEYYKGVLFLTTNRADLVDDAIASRCMARIDYKAPTPEDQKRIWEVLADTAKVEVDSPVIDQVVARFPKQTGRDVKNLLKLAQLVSSSWGCPITLDVIRFVKRFKPTLDPDEPVDTEPVRLPQMPKEKRT